MSTLSISERQVGGATILDLSGKIALGESNQQLHKAIRRLIGEGKNKIILNLAKVASMDSSGLGEIVGGFSTVKAAGGSLKLINIPERLGDLMTITKLHTVFEIYDTEEAGVNAFETDGNATNQINAKAGSSLL
jgi:anti-sigma B factor antagonist